MGLQDERDDVQQIDFGLVVARGVKMLKQRVEKQVGAVLPHQNGAQLAQSPEDLQAQFGEHLGILGVAAGKGKGGGHNGWTRYEMDVYISTTKNHFPCARERTNE